jgi:3-hydroxyisobutyrate dehydrogenase
VTVYNRTTAKAEAWANEHGGAFAATPREAAAGAEFVMACVGNDDDLRSVVLGEDGALAGMAEGASSSITPRFRQSSRGSWPKSPARRASAGSTRRSPAVRPGPRTASSSSCAAGLRVISPPAEPVIDAYSKMTERFGDVGAGQLTKMVNQICIVGAIQSISEGLYFARPPGSMPRRWRGWSARARAARGSWPTGPTR